MIRNSIVLSSLVNSLVITSVLAADDCALILQKKMPASTAVKQRKTRLLSALESQTEEELLWQGTSMITTTVNVAHIVRLQRPQGMTYDQVKELEAKIRAHVEGVLKQRKKDAEAQKPINTGRVEQVVGRAG